MRRLGQSSIFPSRERPKTGVAAVSGARFPPGADIAHKTDGRFNRIKSHPVRLAMEIGTGF